MKQNRREFLRTGGATVVASCAGRSSERATDIASKAPGFVGKRLGTIFNNDINGLLMGEEGRSTSGENTTPEEYQKAVYSVLDSKPVVLAQNVGMPDPVIYRTSVATTWDKYHAEVWLMVLKMKKQ